MISGVACVVCRLVRSQRSQWLTSPFCTSQPLVNGTHSTTSSAKLSRFPHSNIPLICLLFYDSYKLQLSVHREAENAAPCGQWMAAQCAAVVCHQLMPVSCHFRDCKSASECGQVKFRSRRKIVMLLVLLPKFCDFVASDVQSNVHGFGYWFQPTIYAFLQCNFKQK